MLVAQNSNGDVFSLTSRWSREALQRIREEGETFLCPSCKQPVRLKIGNERIPHFAHVSQIDCNSFSERESEYHLKGKLQLYDWLQKKGYHPILEPYFHQLNQRPDLSTIINGRRYMIEFQCSTMDKEVFRNRNQNYVTSGYKPFWILGAKRLKRVSQNQFTFNSFDWQFIKLTNNQSTLLYYCSESKKFLELHHIIPLSSNTVYAGLNIISKDQYSIIKKPKKYEHPEAFDSAWYTMKRNWRLSCTSKASTSSKKLFRYLYEKRINPSLIPSEIGNPVPSMYWIQTHPILWQAWLTIDFIHKIPTDKTFTFQDAYAFFKKLVMRERFIIRELPFIRTSHYSIALLEYLHALITFGVLSFENNHTFRKVKDISFPKFTEEALNLDLSLLKLLRQKNKGL